MNMCVAYLYHRDAVKSTRFVPDTFAFWFPFWRFECIHMLKLLEKEEMYRWDRNTTTKTYQEQTEIVSADDCSANGSVDRGLEVVSSGLFR